MSEETYKISGKWDETLTVPKRPNVVKNKVVFDDWKNVSKEENRYHKWISISRYGDQTVMDAQLIFVLARLLKTKYKIKEGIRNRVPDEEAK